MVPWAHPSQPSQWHLDRFSRFCWAHEHDQETDRPCYSICSNRPHLASATMWPNNTYEWIDINDCCYHMYDCYRSRPAGEQWRRGRPRRRPTYSSCHAHITLIVRITFAASTSTTCRFRARFSD